MCRTMCMAYLDQKHQEGGAALNLLRGFVGRIKPELLT